MPRWLAVNHKCFRLAAKAVISMLPALLIALTLSSTLHAQGPALTTISGTVYRADGSAASGTALISWPSFQSAEGDAVAAGNLAVTIGPEGVFSAQLVPNVGASPAGTYYVVVFQLDDGTVRTEYWAVPATSPTTITAVLTTPGMGLGNLAATQEYVNGAVANRAVDATVVHLAGTETISGTKQFAVSPALPAPAGANDAANKGYVDAAVANVGAGAFVSKTGDTMTGPLTLPSDPTAPNQAADRHYVDTGLSVKADLVNGNVPTGELGAGIASANTCLTGNSTWGSCGGGAPAGITYATTALNWTQSLSTSLTGGSASSLLLTPCPVGVDTTSGAGYQVYILDGGNSEAVSVTGGTCTSGGASGTITFTPFFNHTTYTVESASSGIQETINAACGTIGTYYRNIQCNVTVPANGGPSDPSGNHPLNTYNVFGTIYLHANQSVLSGYGVSLNCLGRGPCLQAGDRLTSNHYLNQTVAGFSFRSPTNFSSVPAYAGVAITNTVVASTTATITTASAHGFRPGDMVVQLFTDDSRYWGDAIVLTVPTTTSYTYAHSGTISSQATPGVTALAYEAILDNGFSTHFVDITYDYVGEGGKFNNFFDMWDDENATIDHFTANNGLNASINWTGAFVFSGGAGNVNITAGQLAPVITVRDSTITANYSNGITAYNSNGLYIENTVIQASGPWQVFSSNTTGNYQGATLSNLYSESTINLNPFGTMTGSVTSGSFTLGEKLVQTSTAAVAYLHNVPTGSAPMLVSAIIGTADATHTWVGQTSAAVYTPTSLPAYRSPFPGLGIAGLIADSSSGAASFNVKGNGTPQGAFQTGGAGATLYTYYIVANDATLGSHTSPLQVLNWSSTGSDLIPVHWPRIANGTDTITYDVIRMTTPGAIGSGNVFPYKGGCPGGSGGTCGSVATGLSQGTACAGSLVCTFQDVGSSTTSNYTISQGNYETYNGNPSHINFWPGALVTGNKTVGTDSEISPAVGIGLASDAMQVANRCTNYGIASPGGYTVCTSSHDNMENQAATLLMDGPPFGAGMTQTKGRLSFPLSPYAVFAAHHIITLIDSQPALTEATPSYRPPANANDTWIGTDVSGSVSPASARLAFGAPVSISNYIGNVGDNTSWLERLSASLKEFNVAAKFDQSVTLAGMSNGCLNVVSGVIASTGSPCGSGGSGGAVSSVFGRSGTVVAASGDYTVFQVTGAAADASVVHNTGTESITGAKTFTSNVTVSGNLVLPQGNGYVPPTGGIGLDTAAGLPVVNLGGTTQQVAFTSSNISGQAGTALALAAVPTQCSGSFATGIGANGNANCTTPNVIQLSETTPPAGIPNWGVFWFDAATHTPRVIDNNGQVAQLGMTNLFNSDPGGDPADNLEERNGSAAQNLRVYSNYANNTTWARISLGSETIGATNYNVLRSEDATSGNALSLGMHIGSGIKWFFSSDGTFKPNSDYSYDIGTDTGQAVRSVFAKTSFNMYSTGRQDFEFLNDATNGTTLNQLAIYNSGATGVQTAATSSTDGVVGIISGGAGTSNKAVITWAGLAACNFDAANPVAGDYVVASTTQAGKCHDAGSTTRPTGAQVIGRIESGGVRVSLGPPSGSSGGGAVSSVFGRTGAVTAANGDYSVSQVSGAAADSAVVHLAGAETITGAKTFSGNVTLTGNLNVAGNILQTGAGPTQWSGVEWSGTTVTVPSGMNFSLGVGSDSTLKCQLSSGASCMPTGGAVASVFGRTGAVTAASGDYTVSQVTGAAALASPVFTGSPTAPTPSSGDNSTKLATTAYVRSEIQMAWSCPVAGTTSTVQYCNWTVPAGITITGFDLAASTAAAGCTTYPTLQVWDGMANAEVGSYSIAFTSGTNFFTQVTGSTNVASGHLLRLKITTAGAGCSTNAGGVVGTVTYQMQN